MTTSMQTFKPQEFLKTWTGAIKNALSTNMDLSRMLSIITNEFRLNPKLMECTQTSVGNCILQACQVGLRPGALLGQFYLIPYRNNKKNVIECQFILGYKGMIELAMRGDGVKQIEAHAVYAGDMFEYEYGMSSFLKHVPAKENHGELITCWALATLRSDIKQFHVIDKEGIDRAKSFSKTPNVWDLHYEAMARKTAVRRLYNYLPINPDLQLILALDDAADRGEQVAMMGAIYEGGVETIETEEETPQEAPKSNVDQLKEVLKTTTK